MSKRTDPHEGEDCHDEFCECGEDHIDWKTRRLKDGDSRAVGEAELALEDTDELPPVYVPIIQGCVTCNGRGWLRMTETTGIRCEDCHGTGIKTEYYAEPDDH